MLEPRLQLHLVQVEIVDSANAQDAMARERRTDTIHQGSACRAKVVGHQAARCDSFRLSKRLEVFLPAQVLQVSVGDGKVGCEHGRGDFATVGAVADKGINQAGTMSRL